jgi:hypothetical protein
MTMQSDMERYEERCKEIAKKEVDAPWRKSPFFRPLEFTALTPPCGCKIEGDGNLPSPLRIVFCEAHAKVTGR